MATKGSGRSGEGEEAEGEEPPESFKVMSKEEAENYVEASMTESNITPKSFVDLVDRCLLICDDLFYDVTWDAMVIKHFHGVAKAARVNGTLFTRKWNDDPIPPFLTEEVKRRSQLMISEDLERSQVVNIELVEPNWSSKRQLKERVLLEPDQGSKQLEEKVLLLEPNQGSKRLLEKADVVVEDKLMETDGKPMVQETTPLKMKTARGKRSLNSLLRRKKKWLAVRSRDWTDKVKSPEFKEQDRRFGRRGWVIGTQNQDNLLPIPKKLNFSPKSLFSEQNQDVLVPQLQEEKKKHIKEVMELQEHIPLRLVEEDHIMSPSTGMEQGAGEEERRKKEEDQQNSSWCQWIEEEKRLLDTRFTIWLKDIVKAEVEEVLRQQETSSLRLGRVKEEGQVRVQDLPQNSRGIRVLPSNTTQIHPVSASSFQNISMLRQEGDVMVGVGEASAVPQFVELWGECGGEGEQRAFCWSCKEWGTLVRFG